MIRFLTIIACLAALTMGALLFTSRFTITLTIRPLDAPQHTAPAVPSKFTGGTPASDVSADPIHNTTKPAPKRVDSHHTAQRNTKGA